MYNIKIYNIINGNSINFSPFENIAITNIDGLTSNDINLATSQGFSQIGTTIQGTSVNGRPITVDGEFFGISTWLREKMLKTITPQETLKIIFDNKIFLLATAQNTPDISRSKHNATFQFILYAGYPYWRSLEMSRIMLGGLDAKFMFPINYGDPAVPDLHHFGVRVQESYKNIVNKSDIPVPFKIVFYARTTLENPMIQNIETLEYIRIKKEMEPGEQITIDMTNSILNITQGIAGNEKNAMKYFDLNSTLPFRLKVGDNLIKFDSDSGRDNLDCYIYYYTETVGAYGSDDVYI